jgi:hypothetical protein
MDLRVKLILAAMAALLVVLLAIIAVMSGQGLGMSSLDQPPADRLPPPTSTPEPTRTSSQAPSGLDQLCSETERRLQPPLVGQSAVLAIRDRVQVADTDEFGVTHSLANYLGVLAKTLGSGDYRPQLEDLKQLEVAKEELLEAAYDSDAASCLSLAEYLPARWRSRPTNPKNSAPRS